MQRHSKSLEGDRVLNKHVHASETLKDAKEDDRIIPLTQFLLHRLHGIARYTKKETGLPNATDDA
jgi:hypothetical protein